MYIYSRIICYYIIHVYYWEGLFLNEISSENLFVYMTTKAALTSRIDHEGNIRTGGIFCRRYQLRMHGTHWTMYNVQIVPPEVRDPTRWQLRDPLCYVVLTQVWSW